MWGCIYGEIRREFSIMSSLQKTRLLNSSKYPSRLDQLKAALNKKHLELVNRKCIIFRQDTARLHVSLMTRPKLLQLGWEVLIHLPYSPDIAPPGVHLFQSLQKPLTGKKFSIHWKIVRYTWNSFLLRDKNLGKMELWGCLKNGKRQWNKTVLCPIKHLVKMKNMSFIST